MFAPAFFRPQQRFSAFGLVEVKFLMQFYYLLEYKIAGHPHKRLGINLE
jgi:hypothetical protein